MEKNDDDIEDSDVNVRIARSADGQWRSFVGTDALQIKAGPTMFLGDILGRDKNPTSESYNVCIFFCLA